MILLPVSRPAPRPGMTTGGRLRLRLVAAATTAAFCATPPRAAPLAPPERARAPPRPPAPPRRLPPRRALGLEAIRSSRGLSRFSDCNREQGAKQTAQTITNARVHAWGKVKRGDAKNKIKVRGAVLACRKASYWGESCAASTAEYLHLRFGHCLAVERVHGA